MHIYIRLFVLFLHLGIALLLSSCKHGDLENSLEVIQVRIVVKSDHIPNISSDIYNEQIPHPQMKPETLRVMFFDSNTQQLVTETFISTMENDGEYRKIFSGKVKLYPGTYDMLCYNFDMPYTMVKNENEWKNIEAYTEEISNNEYEHVGSIIDGRVIFNEPDHLLTAQKKNITIKSGVESRSIEAVANTIMDTYYIQVGVNHAKYISSASAVLMGFATSNRIALDERYYRKESGMMIFLNSTSAPRDTSKMVLCTAFNTFGTISESSIPMRAGFHILTTGGEVVDYVVDMDSIFQKEDAQKRHWLLLNQIIDIPVPENPDTEQGGGFNPSVSDWETEYGEVTI